MRRRSRLAIGATLALVTAVVAALLLTAGPAKAKGFATLHILEGTVDVRPVAASVFHEATEGEALYAGDTVDTGAGRAEVRYFDGSVTRLDFQTVFTLEELEAVGRGGKVITARQSGGKTFSRVVKLTGSESRFDVATPTATASVRGTGFVTRHLLDGRSLVWVLHGMVQVGHGGSSTPVPAGQGIEVDTDGSTSGPFMLTAAQLNDPWVQFNLCDLEDAASCAPDVVLGEHVVRAEKVAEEEAPSADPMVVAGDTAPHEDPVAKPKKKKKPKDDGGGQSGSSGGDTGGNTSGNTGGGTQEPPTPTLVDQVCEVLEQVGDQVGVDPPDPPCV